MENKEEILKQIALLERGIARLQEQVDNYYNEEQSIKLVLNSIYGALGNQHFTFFNPYIAEAVTSQGKEIILFSERMLNTYFKEYWVRDYKLHEKLGVKNVNKINDTVVVYSDTDSIFSESIIRTNLGNHTIQDFFNKIENEYKNHYVDIKGNEIIDLKDCGFTVKNYKNGEIVDSSIKKLIRHKVTKSKWKIKTKSGKEIIVTNDHSIIVFRDGKELSIKPSEINLKTDKILTVESENFDYIFSDICICNEEEIKFQNEYVYDIEVDDETHTFIANDILVHNSNYVSFDELFKSCDYSESKYVGNEINMILDIYEFRLKDYIDNNLKKFAKERNTDNYQKFELETISHSGIWLGKKKYSLDLAWKAPNSYFDSLTKIKNTGIEIIQSSTPEFVRGEMDAIIKYFLRSDNINLKELTSSLYELKQRYIKEPDIDKKCKNVKINDYAKYCIDDIDDIKVKLRCPIHVRGSVCYNYKLNNSKYKEQYENITSGTKVKMYYTKGDYDVFSYLPTSYPTEFAPLIDDDIMFEKTVISPVNTFLDAMGVQQLSPKLEYKRSLF